ncbi:hypothetical protein FNF31_06272 [Cafeteria roenbergensis]|uniref:ATP-dependent RNA helicase n=1 Tax=Cafeteria roenbergensis TaxID=33653 RepID=A0A5A8CQ47_CAFRO|nr:hypothetical protein FNF31_06272 [Cafeteria roenbergensis]
MTSSAEPAAIDRAAVFADEALRFEDMGLHADVLRQLRAAGIDRPTTVQADAAPEILGGKDVLCLAETGSGKTLAYLTPLLNRIYESGGPAALSSPVALVLAPTQELVLQVCHVIRDVFPEALPHTRAAYANVAPPRSDEFCLLVATPRAVRESVNPALLRAVQAVVVDEADLLLGPAYAPDTRGREGVLTTLRNRPGAAEPQAVFCAATLPSAGKRSVGAFLEKSYPRATLVSSERLHRPRQQVSVSWVRAGGTGPSSPSHEQVVEAAMLARARGMRHGREAALAGGDPSPAELALARAGLQHQLSQRVWERKLWTALRCLLPAGGAQGELGPGGSAGPGLSGLVEAELEGDTAGDEPSGAEGGAAEEADEAGRQSGEAGTPARLRVERRGLRRELASLVPPTLVFVSSARRAQEAAEFFQRQAPSLRVASLHGNMREAARHRTARDFAAQDPLSPTARRLAADEQEKLRAAEDHAAASAAAASTAAEAAGTDGEEEEEGEEVLRSAGDADTSILSPEARAAITQLGREPRKHSAKRRWRRRIAAIVEADVAGEEAPSNEGATAMAAAAGAPQVLVCTDIAARGLDTVAVRHVIQLDFAGDAVAHLHRSGRTGRLDRAGAVTNILEPSDEDLAAAIQAMGEEEGGLSGAFSRGRSFRKKLKKAAKRAEEAAGTAAGEEGEPSVGEQSADRDRA